MRKHRAVLISAVALSLSACSTVTGGNAEEPAGDITIVSGQQSQNGALLSGLVAGATKQQKTSVRLRLNNDTDTATAQKTLLDIAAGKGPDAVRVTSATYRSFVDAKVAQPVDECLKSDPAIAGNLDSTLLGGLRYDGTLQEIPWYVTSNALFYNADLFTRAGLDPAHPPATMTELHAAAKKIAALPAKPGGGVAYFGNDYNFQGFVASRGGMVYDPRTGTYTSDSAPGTGAFKLFADMAADKSSPVFTNYFVDANDAFAGGRLGMMVSSTSGFPQLSKGARFDLRMAPVPAMGGGRRLAVTSTNGFVITTKDPERRRLVCTALLSLLTPEAVTQTVKATATIPLNKAALGERYLAPYYRQHPDWVAVRDQPTIAWQSLPGGKNAEYTTAYTDTQTHVLLGDLTPAEAARSLQATARRLLGTK